jgi:hypothetical protein
VEPSAPVAKGRRGAGTRGWHGSARRRAIRGRGGARRRGAGERRGSVLEHCGGDGGRHRRACRAVEEEEERLLHLEVSGPFRGVPVSRGRSLVSYLCIHGVTSTIPALALAKALRSDASVPTRRRSSRATWVTGSAAAVTELPHGADKAVGSRQEVVAATTVTTTVTTAPTVLSAPATAGGDRAAAVEIPDDDAPPPGWGQWGKRPVPAPEPSARVLVMLDDGCVMSRHPTLGAEASSSCNALPAPDGTVARPEHELEYTSAPPAHFSEAQAEQAL